MKLLLRLKLIFFFCIYFSIEGYTQFASIQNTNMQIYGVLNDQKVASATNDYLIKLNKQTGEFSIEIEVDNLESVETTPDFKPDTTKNMGKKLIISGQVPIREVLGKRISLFDVRVPVEVKFNEIYNETYFVFNIFLLANQGFSVMAKGAISHEELEIENLEEFEKDLIVNFSFTGY